MCYKCHITAQKLVSMEISLTTCMKSEKYLMRISLPTLTFDPLKLSMGLRGGSWYEAVSSDIAANGFSYMIPNIANLDLCCYEEHLKDVFIQT